MLNEPHYPSKWSVAIVFFFIILLIGGVFFWAFFLNLGQIVLRSDAPFTAEVSGEVYECEEGICELSFPPGRYQFLLRRNTADLPYFDQEFSLDIQRFTETEREIEFVLIPYLSEVESLPESPDSEYSLRKFGLDYHLISQVNADVISVFETLESPELITAGNLGFVLDAGRLFVVDLETGRKQRRFDDSVVIRSVLPTQDGERSLFFVTFQELDQMWLYHHETDEMTPLSWVVDPELIQWIPGSDHEAFVITDQLQVTTDPSLFSEILESAQVVEPNLGLYRYDFDTEQSVEVVIFEESEIPVGLHRVQDRYFIEYADQKVEELILSEN